MSSLTWQTEKELKKQIKKTRERENEKSQGENGRQRKKKWTGVHATFPP